MTREDRLACLIKIICEKIDRPGKKVLQKLVYLIEREGLDLGFDYSIYYYGPYSAQLDDTLYRLQLQGIVNIVPEKSKHTIYFNEFDNEKDEEQIFSAEEKKIIEEVIERFGSKSANELELITTADFVFQQLKENYPAVSETEIVEKVKKIKGEKFSEYEIREALKLIGF